ncbi:MAG: Calx-beta domain-containing protein, partial [Anaerolineae bacterium]
MAIGGSCGSASPCYSSIQTAVDAATDGDEIRVAAGTYAGAQTKVSATTGYTYTQVALVDGKNLTLSGGYTTTNWNVPDALSYPTIIDAEGYGRGLTIIGSGTQTVTVQGFQIINGDYTNLGNPTGVSNTACPSTSGDCAGGLLAYNVKMILKNALVRNNTASRIRYYSHAGGILFWRTLDGTLVENTQIFSNTNTVYGYGGGMEAHYANGSITIRDSQFDQNHSAYDGGGLLLTSVNGPIIIQNSRFVGNSAVGVSGANGGGISAGMLENMLLDRVEFRGNQAANDGAAVDIQQVGTQIPTLRLINVLAAENQLQSPNTYGSVINIVGGTGGGFDVKSYQSTVAANQAPAGISVSQYDIRGFTFTAALTNTLITDATYGVVGGHYTGTLTIEQTNSLFYNVANQTAVANGAPTFNTAGTVTGDPKLDGNQRLQAGSAAIDAGVNSGVTLDLDGGVRPGGSGYDIGADEYSASDPGSFRFSQANYATLEGSSITITVERVNGTAGAVSVQYVTGNGTATANNDYTFTSGTLNFADGETSKTFTVQTTQDATPEADETFWLTLYSPTGGATLGSPYQTVVTIQDD